MRAVAESHLVVLAIQRLLEHQPLCTWVRADPRRISVCEILRFISILRRND